ncbi:hypothetical protein GCM10023185_02260 [Hymenobacter saemangeumensis]|uniref:STAS/SEC14 domain-containing protein n=1 Tax=Hymenobacter saemangeumensis TaxID=1084522 RepID=A0ABP8HYB0_9BACT
MLEHPDGYALVQYHAGKRKLHHLQAFLTHTGQLLRRNSWNKILGDQRQMEAFTEEETTWIVNYWLQAAQRGENIYGAVLLPTDAYAQLSASQVMEEAQAAALTYRVFDDEEAAQQWLKQLT